MRIQIVSRGVKTHSIQISKILIPSSAE